MVADNKPLVMMFTQALASDLGTVLEMLCIPDGDWTTVREQFIREKNLTQNNTSVEEENSLNEEPFITDEQQLPSEDPLIVEAEKMFGKEFVEVIED